MAGELKLEIVTPSRRLVQATVGEVYLPGATGEMGVLPQHAPLVSVLTAGIVKYEEGGKRRTLAIRSGFLKIASDQVTLLADEAVFPAEVKRADLTTKRREAEAKMLDANVTPKEREGIRNELLWLAAQALIASA